MKRTVLITLSVLLISGSAVQIAAASEHHHNRSKAYFGRDLSAVRGSYNQARPVDQARPVNVAPRAPDRFDPSAPRHEDPVLNPPGS